MEKFKEPTYSVFINKRKINVSYLIFLCHCTKEFKTLLTLDEYALIGSRPLECNNRTAHLVKYEYLNNIHTLLPDKKPSNLIKKVKPLLTNDIFRSSVLFLGIYYREFYTSLLSTSTTTYNTKELKFLAQSPYLLFNKMIGYPSITTTEHYNKLQPWLNFYWKLAISSKDDIITIETLEEVIKKIDLSISLIDIQKDLNKHLIILPYKDYYIWSSNEFYKWLTTESRVVLQALIWDKRLASSSFKLLDY